MPFSRLSLLFVLTEWGCIVAGLVHEEATVFYHVFTYGSPVNLVINLFVSGLTLFGTNPYIIGMSAFHMIKYAVIVKAQLGDDRNWCLIYALLLEAAYIIYSGYLLY